MGKKRKHVEAKAPTPETSDGEVLERPKRTLLGWKDKDNKQAEEGRETELSNGDGNFEIRMLKFLTRTIRALEKKQKAVKYVKKVKAKARRKMEELSNNIERDEFADKWEE
ncbi:hypothetical protein V2J09_006497 [Rumex salicifolius]